MVLVIIVGGGPVGLTAAIFAARACNEVVVLEKESEDNFKRVGSGTVLLGQRGLRALEKAGIPSPDPSFMLKGTVQLSKNKVEVEKSINTEYLFERNELVRLLTSHIAEHFSAEIKIHYEMDLVSIDLQTQKVRCRSQDAVLEYPYGLLIGADGVDNRVCQLLLDLNILSTYVKYKTKDISSIFGPFSTNQFDNLELENHFNETEGRRLLFVKGDEDAQDDNYMHSLIIYTVEDEKYFAQVTFPLVLRSEFDQDSNANSNLSFNQHMKRNYEELVPGSWLGQLQWSNDLVMLCQGDLITKYICSTNSIKIQNILLLGESGNVVPSILSESLNFGLEDCQVLFQVLEDQKTMNSQTNFDYVGTYSHSRQKDIDALQFLELCGLLVTTDVDSLTRFQKFYFLAFFLPNVVFIQLIAILMPSLSSYGFLNRIKQADVRLSRVVKEMFVIAMICLILGMGLCIAFIWLVICFVQIYLVRIGAQERLESLLRLINEAFHFV